jgi:hypothetical protein
MQIDLKNILQPLKLRTMNRLKKLIPLFALAIFTLPAMANHAEESTTEQLRSEIAQTLSKINVGSLDFKESTVYVNFMINDKNQVIVLSTDNEKLDHAIKKSLNYHTLTSVQAAVNKMYILPVKLKQK